MASEYTVNKADLISVADTIRAKRETTDLLLWPDGYKEAIDKISGASLNFEVVGGTTKPANPRENTIWANTAVEIVAWAFSENEPDSPVEGTLWLQTKSSGSLAFNAVKENVIEIRLLSASLYASGVWTDVDVEVYVAGEWKSLFMHIVRNGTAHYTPSYRGFTSSNNNPKKTSGSGYIGVIGTTAGYGGMFFSVDLTGRSTITVEGTFDYSDSGCRLGVWTAIGAYPDNNCVAYALLQSSKLSIDISNKGLKGTYLVGVSTVYYTREQRVKNLVVK